MSADPLAQLEASTPWQAQLASMPSLGHTQNEDLAVVEGACAWVLDGASAPKDPADCSLDTSWYVQRLSTALTDALRHSDCYLTAALAQAISRVASEHKATCSCPGNAAPSATVALVRRRGDATDFLVLGDSTVLLDLGTSVDCYSDKRLANVAPDIRRQIRIQLAKGSGYDDPRLVALRSKLVQAERALRNTEAGYWIASLDPQAASHSLAGAAPIGIHPGEVRSAALLTDGLGRSVTHLGIHKTWDALLRALLEAGPHSCIDAVRAAETSDPKGHRFPRTTGSDDASAIALQFNLSPTLKGSNCA